MKKTHKMAVPNLDGWDNIFYGLGVRGKDKRVSMRATHRPLTETEVDDLYAGDPMSRKIVNKLPEEALRRGLEFKGVDTSALPVVQDYLYSLRAIQNLTLGLQWGRKYGGAVLFPVVDDGMTLDQPLDLTKVNHVSALQVLHRWELYAQSVDRIKDITNPDYGLPKFYTLVSKRGMNDVTIGENGKLPREVLAQGVRIHYTRFIRFDGIDIGPRKRSQNGFWNDSVLTGLEMALKDFAGSHGSAAALVHDFNVAVLTMKKLQQYLQAKRDDDVKAALELMAYAKSVLGMVLLGEGDAFENKARTVTGLSDIIRDVKDYLVSLTEYTNTALLNESPGASLGEGGKSQQVNFYDVVEAYQETVIPSKLDRLLEIVFAAKDGPFNGTPPTDWDYEFPALWQESEGEKATAYKTRAEADDIYYGMGADPKAILRQRLGGTEYQNEIHLEESDIQDIREQQTQANAATPAPATQEQRANAARETRAVMDVVMDSETKNDLFMVIVSRETIPNLDDAKAFVKDAGLVFDREPKSTDKFFFFGEWNKNARVYSPLSGVRVLYGRLGTKG